MISKIGIEHTQKFFSIFFSKQRQGFQAFSKKSYIFFYLGYCYIKLIFYLCPVRSLKCRSVEKSNQRGGVGIRNRDGGLMFGSQSRRVFETRVK